MLSPDGIGSERVPPPRAPHPARAAAYEIAECLLSVEASDERAAHAAEQFLSGFLLERKQAGSQGRTVSCVIRVHSRLPVPRVPREWSGFDVAHGRCFSSGGKLFFDICDSVVSVGARARTSVEVWLGQTERARTQVAVVNALSYALQAALRRAGLLDLHAACVVSPRGRGFLLAGTSGSGKSTLTVQLAARGWSYLTDDMVLLRERGGRVEARGLRRLFSLTDETARASGVSGLRESLGTPAASDPSKRRLEPSSVFPGARAAVCVPQRVLFPRVTRESRSRTRELSISEAMAGLIKLCPWAGYDEVTARDSLRTLAALARTCGAFELEAGTDLLASPALAEGIVSDGV
ncbi:MAG: hypothetical protein LC746_14440 [Acidobacteria bacterium]|nr:hypothetical protein [Acidobacteriota bacterium]